MELNSISESVFVKEGDEQMPFFERGVGWDDSV